MAFWGYHRTVPSHPHHVDRLLTDLGRELLIRDVPRVEFVVVGGAALILQGLADRVTRDVDIVGGWDSERNRFEVIDEIPPAVATCAARVAAAFKGGSVSPAWLNRGPSSLATAGMPTGFEARLIAREFGERLGLRLLGRFDLIALKLFAAIDAGPRAPLHEADLRRLRPAYEELDAAVTWIQSLEGSAAFTARAFGVIRDDLRGLLIDLGFEDLAFYS